MKLMKKYIILLTSAAILSFYGCTPQEQTLQEETDNNTEQNTVPEQNDKPVRIKHEISESADTSGYNKVSEFSFDFDSDGTDDTVELLTTAQVENGEVHRDDGQNWLITVTTQNGTYILYDKYIQLGSAQIDIGQLYNEETENVIILTQTTGAGKSVTHYTFSDGVFYEELVYTTDNYASGGANIVGSIE